MRRAVPSPRIGAWSAVRPPGHGARPPRGERPLLAGGHGRGGTPGPVPNPEVKPPSADGTAEEVRGRAGRRRPTRGVFPLTQRGQGPRAPGRRAGAFFVLGRAWPPSVSKKSQQRRVGSEEFPSLYSLDSSIGRRVGKAATVKLMRAVANCQAWGLSVRLRRLCKKRGEACILTECWIYLSVCRLRDCCRCRWRALWDQCLSISREAQFVESRREQ